MKRNLILLPAVILFILAPALLKNEALIYLWTVLMAITIVTALSNLGHLATKITRWAKTNPRKAQLVITVLQLIILFTGLVVGFDLKQLGYKFSDVTALVFDTLMMVGFLSVHFFPRRAIVTLPVHLNKDRFKYAGIMIAAYAMAVIFGNTAENRYPDSMLSNLLRSVDSKIFLQSLSNNNQHSPVVSKSADLKDEAPAFATFASLIEDKKGNSESHLSEKEQKAKLKAEKKAERQEKRMMKRIERFRRNAAGGASAGTVLLIILLVLTTCAGLCLIVGGFSGGGAGAVALGVVVSAASVWGIVKLTKKKKKDNSNSGSP